MPAPSREAPDRHEKIDWGSLEVQALVACEQYWTPDNLLKPTSLLFLIHAIGRQKQAAEQQVASLSAEKDALQAERDELKARLQKTPWCEICGEVVRECPRCFTVFNTQGDL